MKKQCTKCGRILHYSEFHKNKRIKDGLQYRCKKCRSKCQKERHDALKREVMIFFGGQCVYIENGVQCLKNVKNNLDDLTLSHPNGDGDVHRSLISHGRKGHKFYRALQKRGMNTDGFVVQVMCKSHHRSLDNSGKKNPRYKKGKFNNPIWLKKKYDAMFAEEIAKECGVSCSLILRRLKKFSIKRRKGGLGSRRN